MGIANQSNDAIIQFGLDNGLTFPLLRDTENIYSDYYIPGGQSPYPRDFIIDQDGVVQYANNEYDIEAMKLVIESLMNNDAFNCGTGDINDDNIINILDIVIIVSHILDQNLIPDNLVCIIDMDENTIINVVDIIIIISSILSL